MIWAYFDMQQTGQGVRSNHSRSEAHVGRTFFRGTWYLFPKFLSKRLRSQMQALDSPDLIAKAQSSQSVAAILASSMMGLINGCLRARRAAHRSPTTESLFSAGRIALEFSAVSVSVHEGRLSVDEPSLFGPASQKFPALSIKRRAGIPTEQLPFPRPQSARDAALLFGHPLSPESKLLHVFDRN